MPNAETTKTSPNKKNQNPAIDPAKGMRNFRNISEVENFYRFIHDNGMRREAKIMMEAVVNKLKKSSKKRGSKKTQ